MLSLLAGCDPSNDDADAGAQFIVAELAPLPSPTRLAWAPDGRLFVGDLRGRVTALEFDAEWNEVGRVEVASLLGTESDAILGLAFDPLDGRLFVAHSRLQAGGCEDREWPFRGRISALSPPAYDSWETVVTGLPNGKTSHGVNDMVFLPNGDLLVSIGGVTNAGVPSCAMGGIPESPLSAAVLRLRVHAEDFDGEIRYRRTTDELPSDDQRDGDVLEVIGDRWGSVEATGLRNAFGMERTRTGRVYVLDNGPNPGEGDALMGDVQVAVGEHPDELVLLEPGAYYGHPAPVRGERFYHSSLDSATSDHVQFVQALVRLPASTNGIVQMKTELLGLQDALVLQQFDGETLVLELDAEDLPVGTPRVLLRDFPCLDVIEGPGGELVGTDLRRGRVLIARRAGI